MTTQFLSADQLGVSKSLFATGQALRASSPAPSDHMRHLRVAMPFAPMLLDQDTTLEGRVQIVRSLDNESLAYTAALLGINPDTFPATVTLRPAELVTRVLQAVSDVAKYPTAPTQPELPAPVELETLTAMHLSDTFPLVRMRRIFDAAASESVSHTETLRELTRFANLDVTPPGWVAKAMSTAPVVKIPVVDWTYQTMLLYGTGDDGDDDGRVEVYTAALSDPRQMMTACRALLTAYDIQSVSTGQPARHHLVQRVHDYTVARNTAGDPTLFILCAHQPGELLTRWSPTVAAQLMMTTEALKSSLDFGFRDLHVSGTLKMNALQKPQRVRIGEWVSAGPVSGSIRLLLPALAFSCYVRHPSPGGAYDWLNRATQRQELINSTALVSGINPAVSSTMALMPGVGALPVNDVPVSVQGPVFGDVDAFEFVKSEYLYSREFKQSSLAAVQSRKRGFMD